MVRLGGLIPEGPRRKLMERRLKPGTIVWLDVLFPGAREPMPKFVMLAGSEGEDLYFVISSNPAPFIQRNAALLACQVTVDAASHPFLDYDSHMDCSRFLRLPRDRVLEDLVNSPDRLKGSASADVIEQVLAAVKRAPTLSIQQQTIVVEALTP